MERKTKTSLAFITSGISCILFSLIGFAYSFIYFFTPQELSTLAKEVDENIKIQYFIASYYIMSAVCLVIYALLSITGIQLIRKKEKWTIVLVLIVVFEVLCYLVLKYFWRHPDYALSVGAATGIAIGGAAPQVITLFIVWGPALAYLAKLINSNK